MQILSVHNLYQIRGGEDESCASEESLLKEYGHIVDVYKEHNERISELPKLNVALKTIWSSEAYRVVEAKCQSTSYDLMHVQNFFPLISPAAHHAAQAQGVPVIQTLRNYRLLCPNALFFRSGQVCEDCLGKSIPYPGVAHACYRDSRSASLAVAAMLTAHRQLKTWSNKVDKFITLTHFAREKFIQGGIPAEKIVVKPNFVHPDPGIGSGSGNYALYVGRLSVEKGLDTLLEAWEKLATPFPLHIIGDGPLSDYVEKAESRSAAIKWLGRRPMAEVHQYMGEAAFLIFPSKWYETFGRVAVEAFAKGTPVVAANIGAIAELVDDAVTGKLFTPGDSKDLTEKVQWMIDNPHDLSQMRQNARSEFEQKYTAQANYRRLMEIYASVVNRDPSR